jgi:hypothetical protein
MNYTTITINEEVVGLKFGLPSARYLRDKVASGKLLYENEEITEVGIAYVLMAGYKNNCVSKEVSEKYTFEDMLDFVESALTNNDKSKELSNVITVYVESQAVKTGEADEDGKKKKTGTKSKS